MENRIEPTPPEEFTGLPALRTWAVVYVMVFLIVAIWIGLLIGLERFFS